MIEAWESSYDEFDTFEEAMWVAVEAWYNAAPDQPERLAKCVDMSIHSSMHRLVSSMHLHVYLQIAHTILTVNTTCNGRWDGVQEWRDAYIREGRETLGFGLYLLQK